MAYVLETAAFNADAIIKQVLQMLSVVPVGGTVSADQETAAEFALQAALHSLDATNLYTGNTKETTVSISAAANTGSLTPTGIHSILGGTLYQTSPQIFSPIEYVPAQKLGSFGAPTINHIPTRFTAVLSGQPGVNTHSKVILNAAVQTASTLEIIYRETLTVMTLDSGYLELPPAYLRMVTLMMCVDLAGIFALPMDVQAHFRGLLNDCLGMSIGGAAGVEATPAMRASAAGQGMVPPATGIP